jgi:hypothetical protein
MIPKSEVEPALEPGSYFSQQSYDGSVHIFRRTDDEGEERLPPVANNGSAPITNMPNALASMNQTNDCFWRDQMSGAPNAAAPNARAIATAISRVMSDGVAGGTAGSAMHMRAGLKAMNSRNRQHYSSSTHDAGGPPKGPVNSPAAINQRNRQRWQTGRQWSDLPAGGKIATKEWRDERWLRRNLAWSIRHKRSRTRSRRTCRAASARAIWQRGPADKLRLRA